MTLRTSAVGLALAALVLFPPGDAAADEHDAQPFQSAGLGAPTQKLGSGRGFGGGAPEEEDETRPALALTVGGAITFLSLGVGAIIVSQSDNRIIRDAGLLGAQSGMALAPLAAHAFVGETKRGLWFSLPLLVPIAVNSLIVGYVPGLIYRAPAGIQYTAFISASLSVFGSMLGVLDAVRAGERTPKKPSEPSSPSLAIVPMLGSGALGALFTGSL